MFKKYVFLVLLASFLPSFASAAATTTHSCTLTASKTLTQGMRHADIAILQRTLNANVLTQVAASSDGSLGHETTYFGVKTKAALIKYQELHKAEILTPIGLSKGTGIFGPMTRKKIAALCVSIGVTPVAASPVSPIPTVSYGGGGGGSPTPTPTPSYGGGGGGSTPTPAPTPTPSPSPAPVTPTTPVTPPTPPTPTPTPVTPPSTKFTTTERIQVSSGPLNVRSTANTTGILLGTQATAAPGSIIGGPSAQGGYIWWQVNFDSGVDGFVAEDFLVAYVSPSPTPAPTPTPSPAPSPSPTPTPTPGSSS